MRASLDNSSDVLSFLATHTPESDLPSLVVEPIGSASVPSAERKELSNGPT